MSTHYRLVKLGDYPAEALCGLKNYHFDTDDKNEVTCPYCMRKLHEQVWTQEGNQPIESE